jgi:hypothetical protein
MHVAQQFPLGEEEETLRLELLAEGWNLDDEADVVDGADSQDRCWEALFMAVLPERL